MSANSILGERDSQISNLYVLSCVYEALVTRIHQPFVSAESPVPRLSDQGFRFDLSLQTRPSPGYARDRRHAPADRWRTRGRCRRPYRQPRTATRSRVEDDPGSAPPAVATSHGTGFIRFKIVQALSLTQSRMQFQRRNVFSSQRKSEHSKRNVQYQSRMPFRSLIMDSE